MSQPARKWNMPPHLLHFGAGVILTIFFPLLPLFIEWKYADSVSLGTLLISCIMYSTAIATGYDNILIFVMGFLAAIFFAIPFGVQLREVSGIRLEAITSLTVEQMEELQKVLKDAKPTDDSSYLLAWICIFGFGIAQAAKCFDQYITKRENFIYFPRQK